MCVLDTNYESLSALRSVIGTTSDLGTAAVPILRRAPLFFDSHQSDRASVGTG